MSWTLAPMAGLWVGACAGPVTPAPDLTGAQTLDLSQVPVRPIVGVCDAPGEAPRGGIAGNAVELGDGWVLTAAHVMPSDRVIISEGRDLVVDVTRGTDQAPGERFDGDWALFRLDSTTRPPASIALDGPRECDTVYIVGMHSTGTSTSWREHVSHKHPELFTARVRRKPWWGRSRGESRFWMTGLDRRHDFGSLSGSAIVRVDPGSNVATLVGIYVDRESMAGPLISETVWVGHQIPAAALDHPPQASNVEPTE